jgi:hypothetical protein
MPFKRGPTLAERSAEPGSTAHQPPATPPQGPDVRPGPPGPTVPRHCWVSGLPELPGRWPGLLVEWRRTPDTGRWAGRVVYGVVDASQSVLVEAWVPADHLEPATP